MITANAVTGGTGNHPLVGLSDGTLSIGTAGFEATNSGLVDVKLTNPLTKVTLRSLGRSGTPKELLHALHHMKVSRNTLVAYHKVNQSKARGNAPYMKAYIAIDKVFLTLCFYQKYSVRYGLSKSLGGVTEGESPCRNYVTLLAKKGLSIDLLLEEDDRKAVEVKQNVSSVPCPYCNRPQRLDDKHFDLSESLKYQSTALIQCKNPNCEDEFYVNVLAG